MTEDGTHGEGLATRKPTHRPIQHPELKLKLPKSNLAQLNVQKL